MIDKAQRRTAIVARFDELAVERRRFLGLARRRLVGQGACDGTLDAHEAANEIAAKRQADTVHAWQMAAGAIVLLTDADVRCGPGRIRKVDQAFRAGGEDLLLLPVRTIGEGVVGMLQQEEQAALLGAALGLWDESRPLLANGANLAFRKAAFEAVGRGARVALLAHNGVEAVRIAQAARPDVVTMDLTMPEMDGIECIRNLMRILPKTNILVVSALSDKSTAIAALREGARGFVAKPFSDDELRLALLDVMDVPGARA